MHTIVCNEKINGVDTKMLMSIAPAFQWDNVLHNANIPW